jgi:two-component system, NarL family, response regulator LiaR
VKAPTHQIFLVTLVQSFLEIMPRRKKLTAVNVTLYGMAMAALVFLMKIIEYQFLVRDLSLEFYIGLIAAIFAGLGIWGGLRLTRPRIMPVNAEFQLNQDEIRCRGISPRELEVLQKMAGGLSNQEIADQLFVSLNTIKSHTANLYVKLDARRRTEAIRKARELQILPW